MGGATLTPYRLDVHVPPSGTAAALAEDVRRGLTSDPKWLLPKYLYDERGCELFEAITELPEYYQTRAELGVLQRVAAGLVARARADRAGGARLRLVTQDGGAARRHGGGRRPAPLPPFDISPGALLAAAGRLAEAYPGLRVHGVAGDFERHLGEVPPGRRRGGGWWPSSAAPSATCTRMRAAPFLRAVSSLLGAGRPARCSARTWPATPRASSRPTTTRRA